MNSTKRILLIVNVIWTFIHFILAMMYSGANGSWLRSKKSQTIFPFSENPAWVEWGKHYADGTYSCDGCPKLIEFYDWSEFFLYAGIGWIIFLIYWLMNKK